MTREWVRKHRLQLGVAGFIGLCLFYGLGRVGWYRLVTAKSVQPAQTDVCAMGSLDVAGFRSLIARVERDGESGGGGCSDAATPVFCLQHLLKRRIDAYMGVAGPDMIGRMMAMHAIMRANRAVLISQASVPPRREQRLVPAFGGQGQRHAIQMVELPRRGETFVYALDQRAVGMPGPALFGGGSGRGGGLSYDTGRTSFPTGLYGIAEVVITLSDPALRQEDTAAGAAPEAIDYTEAAWSTRKAYDGLAPKIRAPLPSDSVYAMTSLCPRRPAWLETPAVPSPATDAVKEAEQRRRLFQWADQIRNRPGSPVTPP